MDWRNGMIAGAAFKAQVRFMVINLKRPQATYLGAFLLVRGGQSRCRTRCDQSCGFALLGELSEARGRGAEGSAHPVMGIIIQGV